MTRRGNGDGSIRKRGDGFEGRLQMPDGSRPSVYAKTRQECQNKLRELQTLRAQGRSLGTTDQRIEDFLYHWLSLSSRTHRVSAGTVQAYRTRIRQIAPHIGSMKMSKLKAAHIDNAYAELMDRGLSSRSIIGIHGTMRQAFQHAVLRDQIMLNPFSLVKPPRGGAFDLTVLTGEQLRHLWSANEAQPLYPLWVLLGTTGMRIGEALALRWFSTNATQISVIKSLKREKGKGLVLGPTKNRASERTLDITPFTWTALSALKEEQTVRALDKERDFVFRQANGTPPDFSTIRYQFARALLRAGLPPMRVHDLRHTYATLLLEHRVPVHKVARVLGHANANITSSTYSHVTKTMDDDAVAVTQRIITG